MQPLLTMNPTGKSSTVCEKRCHARNASPGGVSPGREERVRGDDTGEAVGVLADEAQTDQATPVLADEVDVAQVERVEQRGRASTRRGAAYV